nr:ankyrin repeat protein [Oriental turtle dovepox virus]
MGDTPLHYAARSRNSDHKMKTLIVYGSNVNATNRRLLTPLHFAAYSDNATEALEILIAHGANVNSTDIDGRTPMHYISRSYSRQPLKNAVKLLVKHGVL